MKIDKNNPRHLLILAVSILFLFLALPFRFIKFSAKRKPAVVLYGHKLNGNLIPFYENGINKESDYRFYYLTLDPSYYSQLKGGDNVLSGLNLLHMIKVVRSNVVITDHSAHHLKLLKKLTSIKFVDVWHGIPYKGFDHTSFKIRYYDEIWVSSEKMKQMYIDKFGFEGEIVKPVGYARVERLINLKGREDEIRKKYGLDNKKTVLIAPTWQQDDTGRSIIPFGLTLEEFIQSIAKGHEDVQFIFRAHLNVKDMHEVKSVVKNVKIMSFGDYPVGEDFLAVSDVVISDWSSIVFDFMPLGRPVIYLDVPAPFKLGFSLGPEYRFGAVAKDAKSLREAVEEALKNPSKFQKKYESVINKTMDVAYGDTLDGSVVKRSLKRLDELLGR